MTEVEWTNLTFRPDGLEAEYWLDELSVSRASDVGRAVARHGQLGEAVLAALDDGANPDDVIAALEMAGVAQRVTRFRRLLGYFVRPRPRGRRHPEFTLKTRRS